MNPIIERITIQSPKISVINMRATDTPIRRRSKKRARKPFMQKPLKGFSPRIAFLFSDVFMG
jgi:hypothetical protein